MSQQLTFYLYFSNKLFSISRSVSQFSDLDHLPGVGAAVPVPVAVLSRHVLVAVLENQNGGFVHLDRILLSL